MSLVRCAECDAEVSSHAAACPRCGNPFRVLTAPKSRGTAILLALLLGGIGIHKFYLNKPGWGILYMMFCWTFVPAVVGFLEALVYLGNDEASFQKHVGH